MLYVDFVKGHFINFEIDVTALSDAVLADWLVDKDTVEADVQVDGKTVHSVVVTRDLRRTNRTLRMFFLVDRFGEDFLEELKNGKTLHVRYHIHSRTYGDRFLIRGSDKAIELAFEMSKRDARP